MPQRSKLAERTAKGTSVEGGGDNIENHRCANEEDVHSQ